MPEKGVEWIPHNSVLSYEDILFLVGVLDGFGIKKIRFTGGEPLVRKGMLQFLNKVTGTFPGLQVGLTTNGSTLIRDAASLACMGLAGINISLDTLDAGKFSLITRGAELQPVIEGIDALMSSILQSKTKVKINSVLMRGFNDGDMIGQLVNFAFKRGITLRFIEFMPFHANFWNENMFVPFSEVLTRLNSGVSQWVEDIEEGKTEEHPMYSMSGPARYYVNVASRQRIGVISAVSNHFCVTCNRLRVTSTGEIRPCLFDDTQISIAEALKNRDEKQARILLQQAFAIKPKAGAMHNEAAHSDEARMYAIGG